MMVKLTKNEALLSLGIAATVGCDGCIEHHVSDAVDAGASSDEIRDTVDLARRIGGQPSTHCCDEALEALDEVTGVPI
jgi:AhpD family alkylhydroperoxidase